MRWKSTSCGRSPRRHSRSRRCRRPPGRGAGLRRLCIAWTTPARSSTRDHDRPKPHSECWRLRRLSRVNSLVVGLREEAWVVLLECLVQLLRYPKTTSFETSLPGSSQLCSTRSGSETPDRPEERGQDVGRLERARENLRC